MTESLDRDPWVRGMQLAARNLPYRGVHRRPWRWRWLW